MKSDRKRSIGTHFRYTVKPEDSESTQDLNLSPPAVTGGWDTEDCPKTHRERNHMSSGWKTKRAASWDCSTVVVYFSQSTYVGQIEHNLHSLERWRETGEGCHFMTLKGDVYSPSLCRQSWESEEQHETPWTPWLRLLCSRALQKENTHTHTFGFRLSPLTVQLEHDYNA